MTKKTPPAAVQTSMKSGDYKTLMSALTVVDNEANRVLNRGLQARTFFFGIFNLILSAYLIGAYPESFWMVYAAQAILILGYRVYVDSHNTNPMTLYYFLDFCWAANFFMAAIAAFLLLQVVDEMFLGALDAIPNFDVAANYPNFGKIFLLFATGPLGLSVIVLNNALVLHDIELYSGCFIHLWPGEKRLQCYIIQY